MYILHVKVSSVLTRSLEKPPDRSEKIILQLRKTWMVKIWTELSDEKRGFY